MGFLLPTAATPSASAAASLLPIRRRRSAAAASLLRRFPTHFRIPRKPPRVSRIPSVSAFKAPTTAGVFSCVASTSSTFLFVLAAGLLSLSGVRPLPARACAPPPTHQQQEEIEGHDEQQLELESKESNQQEEVEDKKVVVEEVLQQLVSKEINQQEEVEEEKVEEENEEDVQQQLESKESSQQEEVEEEKVEENKEDVPQQLEEDEDEEVRMYSAILSGNPGDVDALKCLLYAKMKRADWGEALRYAQSLRDAEPGELEWRLTVAQLHELNGDLDEAERQFREVLAEEPLNVRALHGLALCMQKKLEGPAVFEMLENALQLAISEKRVPEERNIKLLIAQMHVVMGQLDIASEKLQSLVNEDPRDFRSHLCQGIVDALSGRKEDADKQFDIYRSLVPDEFPDKSFINDVILAAKMESQDRLQ